MYIPCLLHIFLPASEAKTVYIIMHMGECMFYDSVLSLLQVPEKPVFVLIALAIKLKLYQIPDY